MICAEVFKKIDELNDTYLNVWEQACTIESPTNYKAGVDAVGGFFAKMAEARGWKVEYSRQKISGDVVCITMNPQLDAAPIFHKSIFVSGYGINRNCITFDRFK